MLIMKTITEKPKVNQTSFLLQLSAIKALMMKINKNIKLTMCWKGCKSIAEFKDVLKGKK